MNGVTCVVVNGLQDPVHDLASRLPDESGIIFHFQADICRSDLDVEIEGVASHDLPAAVNASRVNPL